jgi:hypothetical protein
MRDEPRQEGRPRRLLLAAAAVVLLLTLAGGGYAVGGSVFDRWVNRGDPKRIGERGTVAAEDEWSLQAWKSTRGICLGVTVDGEPAFSGCGMLVVGAPTDTVYEQPPNSHVIGWLLGSSGEASYVTGPVSANVARVEVELADGSVVEADLFDTPDALDSPLRFYFLKTEPVRNPRDRSVNAVVAYDDAGRRLERLAPPG